MKGVCSYCQTGNIPTTKTIIGYRLVLHNVGNKEMSPICMGSNCPPEHLQAEHDHEQRAATMTNAAFLDFANEEFYG